MQYVFPFIIDSNVSKWKQNEMERRRFTQHENTIGHKNQGRKIGQFAVTNFLHVQPVPFSDLSISLRLLCAWWLSKEDVAIDKFESLVSTLLVSHGFIYFTILITVLDLNLKAIKMVMLHGIWFMLLQSILIKY